MQVLNESNLILKRKRRAHRHVNDLLLGYEEVNTRSTKRCSPPPYPLYSLRRTCLHFDFDVRQTSAFNLQAAMLSPPNSPALTRRNPRHTLHISPPTSAHIQLGTCHRKALDFSPSPIVRDGATDPWIIKTDSRNHEKKAQSTAHRVNWIYGG